MTSVNLRVDAPAHARNHDRILSHYGPDGPPVKHSPAKKLFYDLLGIVPAGITDAVYAHLHLLNRAWFPSKPGGAPVAREEGSWTFAVVGDYGQPTPSQKMVADNIARSGARFILTTGDNDQSNGTEADFQRNWDPIYRPLSKLKPMFPAVGNHDGISEEGLSPYFSRFPHLEDARYYTHVQGDLQFFALDSSLPLKPGTPQYAWLEAELRKSSAKHRIIYMHHPMLTQLGANVNSAFHDLAPLLRRHGVKLVLTGHEHYYERSQLAGITHVVVGNGGSSTFPFPLFQAPWSEFRDGRYGHLEIEVQSGQLVGRMITRDGDVVDTFTVPPADAPARDAARGARLLASQRAAA